jgi:predicted RecB family nuclease
MRHQGAQLELSATDISNHLACRHLSELDRRVAFGELARPTWTDPALDLLRKRGKEHERAYVDHLRSSGKRVVDLDGVEGDEAVRRTLEAARAGTDAIVQAALAEGRWHGPADLLERVDRESELGGWAYDVLDTKLAQETRGGTVLQLCLYADLVATVQGRPAERMAVVKPGPGFPREEFRFADFHAYYRLVKGRLVAFADRNGAEESYPEPVPHCDICRWWQRCDQRRHDDDHLSLVAGMRILHAGELRRQGASTLTDLARTRPLLRETPQRGHRDAFEKLQAQAAVQLHGRIEKRPVSELVEFGPGRGLARLPAPSAGDVFLDFEGDPFVPENGLEYLLGYAFADGKDSLHYKALWGLDRAAEKRALETFVDFVLERLERYPNLYIYHYAPYEPAALKRLASRHPTRERELDVLLRGERFVDLLGVTRQGLRASVESYSLKALEGHFGYVRKVKLREEASPALQRVACALQLGTSAAITQADRDAVQGYNCDDCMSLVALRTWLEAKRAELVGAGAPVDRPPVKDGRAPEEREERSAELQKLCDALVEGIPAEAAARTAQQRARWLLAHMIDYFQREDRVAWWEYFARREADDEELRDDRKAIVGLEFVKALPKQTPRERTPVHRYRFPPQETSLDEGDLVRDVRADFAADKIGKIAAIDPIAGTLDIKKHGEAIDRHPMAIHEYDRVDPAVLAASLQDLARWVAENGINAPATDHRAARDLLQSLPPRTRNRSSGSLSQPGEEPLDGALRIARDLDRGVLAIQGPPGAGKTFVGAQMTVALVREGRRVGITATSHKVVRGFLEKTLREARKDGVALLATHKPSSKAPRSGSLPDGLSEIGTNPEAVAALDHRHVVGGVAWLWAAPEAEGQLDYLFIDEAGQMSLAQVLACARSARNLILLGDPQQLQQPQRGAHPEGAEVSALDHLLGGARTIGPSQGLFLAETWRLPPSICAFTSDLFYDGRLHSRPDRERQQLTGPTPFAGSGLFLVPVEHYGNTSSSREEVVALQRIVASLLAGAVTWTDHKGRPHPLIERDLLLIAPYNAQVATLNRALRPAHPDLAIGTVDLFQGQERPVVLCSLTSSSALDAPRGLGFLYDLRLNVATSRAQCACIVVASPALFEPECRAPEQMRLANGLCRYRELAKVVAV